ncbi:MAG: SDR family oxidoreductase [Myxococcota bacterium]
MPPAPSLPESTPRALITGASSGIGEAFARAFAERGSDLVLVARRESLLEALRSELESAHGVSVELIAVDLAEEAGITQVIERLERGDITLLVNNAGIGGPGAFADTAIDVHARILRLNTEVVLRLTHAALGPMRARRAGRIVQISSLGAFQSSPYFALYCATKAWVLSFSEALHEELRGEGIQVLTVCPGFTRTGFQEANHAEAPFLPGWLWSQPHHVIDATLRSLERGDAVLVPRWHDWWTSLLAKTLPRKLVRRVAAETARRV